MRSGSTVRRAGLGVAAAWLSAVVAVGTQGAAPARPARPAAPAATAAQAPAVRPATAATAPAVPPALTPDEARGTLQKYCVTCHNDRARAGGLSLAATDPARVAPH